MVTLLLTKLSCVLGDIHGIHVLCPGQDEWPSWSSSGHFRGATATGGADLGLIRWSKTRCFDTCRGCVDVCDFRWSASTGWPSIRSSLRYHACRHGVRSCAQSVHIKPCFHCRAPFSMTWASATSMKMMRSLFSCLTTWPR